VAARASRAQASSEADQETTDQEHRERGEYPHRGAPFRRREVGEGAEDEPGDERGTPRRVPAVSG
jgi:hypothetical protein